MGPDLVQGGPWRPGGGSFSAGRYMDGKRGSRRWMVAGPRPGTLSQRKARKTRNTREEAGTQRRRKRPICCPTAGPPARRVAWDAEALADPGVGLPYLQFSAQSEVREHLAEFRLQAARQVGTQRH